jgi:hypothetical protein
MGPVVLLARAMQRDRSPTSTESVDFRRANDDATQRIHEQTNDAACSESNTSERETRWLEGRRRVAFVHEAGRAQESARRREGRREEEGEPQASLGERSAQGDVESRPWAVDAAQEDHPQAQGGTPRASTASWLATRRACGSPCPSSGAVVLA